MKKVILLLFTASLLSISGSTVAHRPEPAGLTELEQSLKELDQIIDSLDKAYENIDSNRNGSCAAVR